MKLDMQVGLVPGHIVLDRDPAPPPQKKGAVNAPNFRPISVVAKWLDGSRCHLVGRYSLSASDIVLDGSSPPQKGSRAPNFRPLSRGQTAGWIKMPLGMEVGLGPGHIVLDRDPAPPPPKGGGDPNFQPISVVAQWLDGSRCHLV